MTIGIIDADLLDNGTRHPNLALMKISGYYKAQGEDVKLIQSYNDLKNYSKIYISKVFNFTKIPNKVLKMNNIIIGGTGFFEDGGENLPDGIEHHMPDYDLYLDFINEKLSQNASRSKYADYLDYSIGFSTRGCFRKCKFCVNKKYDRPFKHSPISEFLAKDRPYIYLWDDNFFAFSDWEEILDEIEKTGKPFQFRQGLDIRLMTAKKAERFSKTKYHGDFIFAFDHLEDRDLIENKLKLWRRYSNKTTKLYVLCAFESLDEIDIKRTFERIKILMKYGCLPYIMRYEKYKESKHRTLYVQLARWCNQPQFFKKKSFREFCEANQFYHKNPETNCSAYQAMLDFEKEFPEIAKEYFDLKFEQENVYLISYGYAQKYPHKQDCELCSKDLMTWSNAYLKSLDINKIFELYFTKEKNLQCILYQNSYCKDLKDTIGKWFIEELEKLSWADLFAIIKQSSSKENIEPSNIPQYSDLNDAIFEVPKILYKYEDSMSYDQLGYFLDNGKEKNQTAQRKYGENHSKLSTLLDLTTITMPNNNFQINLSILGKEYAKISKIKQEGIIAKLMLRIPIIQKILSDATDKKVYLSDYMEMLTQNTLIRRKGNVQKIIKYIQDHSDYNISEIVSNIGD